MEETLNKPKMFKIGQKLTVFSNEEIAAMNLLNHVGNQHSSPNYVNGGMPYKGIENCVVTSYSNFSIIHDCWHLFINFNLIGENPADIKNYKMVEKEFKEFYADFDEELIAPIDHIPAFKISYKNRSGIILTETIEANTYEEALTKIEYTDIHYYMEL